MHLSFFLKIVAFIYLFWYIINILIDVIKSKQTSASIKEKEIVQLAIPTENEDRSITEDDVASQILSVPEETVQVNLEMFEIPNIKPSGNIKNKSRGSMLTDLGLEILSKPGLNVSEMSNQDINDYDFL